MAIIYQVPSVTFCRNKDTTQNELVFQRKLNLNCIEYFIYQKYIIIQ